MTAMSLKFAGSIAPPFLQLATTIASPVSAATWNRLRGSHRPERTLGRSQILDVLNLSNTAVVVCEALCEATAIPILPTNGNGRPPLVTLANWMSPRGVQVTPSDD